MKFILVRVSMNRLPLRTCISAYLEWPWKGNESCDFLSRYKISFDEHDLCAVVKM